MSPLSRRALLAGGVGAVGLGAAGAVGWQVAPTSLKARVGLVPDPFLPDAAEGQVRLETVSSAAMDAEVGLYTAVPAGHGDGAGLPVVVVLHGASASAERLVDFELGRFVTASAESGATPFVLAATDDGPAGWVPDGGDADPQRMVREELPGWLAERGFDADRRVLWGWSRGAYGILRLTQLDPGFARAAALFSPALTAGDPVYDDLDRLVDLPLGVWCGEQDSFYDATTALVDDLSVPPEVLTYGAGEHTRYYWNDHTLEAFAWLASKL